MGRRRLRLRGILLLFLFLIPSVGTVIYQKEYGFETEESPSGQIAVHIYNGQQEERLSLDDYLKGVIAAQLPADAADEMVKAMAVVDRTYAAYVAGDRMTLDGQWLGQTWLSAKERQKKGWLEEKLDQAVSDTNDCKIYSGEDLILPLYFRLSNGRTRSFEEVWGREAAWLVPVDSLWDKNAPDYVQTVTYSGKQLANILSDSDPSASEWKQITPSMIQIVGKDDSGYVRQIQIGGQTYEGEALRYLLELPSSCFDVLAENDRITFTCYGEGHGVGLSLYGGNAMALEGKDYTEILSYYFTGTEIR
ncbi:MAG TPA: SpoIID/LytB domain-containing protein [Candidatus Onthocola gallistercoris]|uniref:SpoIID/LytB domain-containing protein n=1 Tax=Candidatus Onthocola gallistercoris TaxID=2840876 RepID=A0A9D1KWU4_9FIRM|nr:SpoIID/LytB domain-containing protein [Candidatus Onthocola gallistercoris]